MNVLAKELSAQADKEVTPARLTCIRTLLRSLGELVGVKPATLAADYKGNVPGRPNVCVMGGDMVARGFSWPFYLGAARPAWRVWQVAARNWRVDDAVAEFDAVAELCVPADMVVLSFGESECADAWMKNRKVEDFGDCLRQLVGKVRAHEKTKNAAIVFVTPFPVRKDWLGRDASKYAIAGPDAVSLAFAEAFRKLGKHPVCFCVRDYHPL